MAAHEIGEIHMGRSWTGHELEDQCPCLKERCGLVSDRGIDPECPQHGYMAARTMRQLHDARHCPGRPALARWWVRGADAVAARRERRERRRHRRALLWRFDWHHPRASLRLALGIGADADGQAQSEIVSRARWFASYYLRVGQWFWDGKDDCWRCGAQPSDVDFLVRRVGFCKAECIDAVQCREYTEAVGRPSPDSDGGEG